MSQQMSRESRRIIDELNRLANKSGVQGLVPVRHIYECDALIIEFYTQPIINILKSRLAKISNKEWKHFTVDYWYLPIINMLQHNDSAKRGNIFSLHMSDTTDAFGYITNQYLISDYSIQDAILINQILHMYTLAEIKYACEIGKQNGVREVRYINAVLDKESAKKRLEVDRINRLNSRIESADTRLERQTVNISPIDLAVAQYSWEQRKNDAELQNKFKELFGE